MDALTAALWGDTPPAKSAGSVFAGIHEDSVLPADGLVVVVLSNGVVDFGAIARLWWTRRVPRHHEAAQGD